MDSTSEQKLMRQWDHLREMRSGHDAMHQAITRFLWPNGGDFTTIDLQYGSPRNQLVFDSSPVMAMRRSTAIQESLFAPRNTMWQRARSLDDSLDSRHDVKEYLVEIRKLLFSFRNSSRSDFYGQNGRSYFSLSALGNHCYTEELMPDGSIRYENVPVQDAWPVFGGRGLPEMMFRRKRVNALEASERFGEDSCKAISDAIQKGRYGDMIEFLHCVKPRPGYDKDSPLATEMPYEAQWISVKDKKTVEVGGYRTFPYQYTRVDVIPGDWLGTGIGHAVMPDVMALHTMERDDMNARGLALQPPLLVSSAGKLGQGNKRVSMRAKALIFGGLDSKGRRMVDPLLMGQRFDVNADKQEQKRDAIRQAFNNDLLQIFTDRDMTAAEVMARLSEKGQLIAPLSGSQNSQWFGPMTEREIDLHAQVPGRMPPMPEALAEAQGEVELVYENEAKRLIDQRELVSMRESVAFLSELATLDPTVKSIPDVHAMARRGFEINGVGADMLNSPEESKAAIEAEAEQGQIGELAELFPGVAKGSADLANAGLIAQGA